MSKILYVTFLFLISFSKSINAQHTHIPLVTDSAQWITVEEDWKEGQGGVHTFDYFVARIDGLDTVINSKKYNCYFGELPSFYLPMKPYKTLPKTSASYIREDTVTKKVWYLRNIVSPYKEEILYDFSLKKGDTINDEDYYYFAPTRLYPYKAWVDNVDSVQWADGKWRYRWWIKSNYGGTKGPAKATIIEGMGYTTNLLEDPFSAYHSIVYSTTSISCFAEKGLWLYTTPNPWNADCDTMFAKNVDPVSIKTALNKAQNIFAYPNPVRTDGRIYITNTPKNNNSLYLIRVYSFAGNLVMEANVFSGGNIDLSKYNLHQGNYLLVAMDSENQVLRQQLLLF
ncbi:hypothetical protein CAP35_04655 [Chitinophagaceae bacterium IBVUCB1]|nr:hypothetical protein CAP35_04655 [Chitinophagaceae bacterium IBVUCB1]